MFGVRFALAQLWRSSGRAVPQTLWHLALLAMMLLAFAPSATAFWQCEGQKCGVTSWACCCAEPNDVQNAECDAADSHFTRGEHAVEVGPCVLDCHCTMVVGDAAPHLVSAPFAFASAITLVTAPLFAVVSPAPIAIYLALENPSRGPPSSPFLACAPHRGPPVA